MEKKILHANRFKDAYNLLQPSRPVLVTTLEQNGSTHVATFSWVMPTSADPPLLALALLAKPNKQNSLKNIELHGEFAVNVPGIELAEQLVLCSYKTKPGMKKINIAGLKTIPATRIKPALISQCRSHLECEVLSIQETGDHCLITGKVLAVLYDHESYTSDLILNINICNPCIHLTSYGIENGQAHVFVQTAGTTIVEVPFVNR